MKRQLLLVGDEPGRLRETPGFLATLDREWTVSSARDCVQALEFMHQAPCAAVVSDLRLPGLSGTQFLDDVMNHQPAAHRFILADLADRQTLLKCVATRHQFLAKPCDARQLLAALDRAFQIEVWFANDAVKKLLGQMTKMPSPPSSYFQIVRELQSPAASMENVGSIIAQDLAVSAKLLQLVNSAAFGLQRQVSEPAEAVLLLGIETTKSLVLLAHSYSHFDKIAGADLSIEALWRHSLVTGRLARAIARVEGASSAVAEESFTAGLLHDIGKLLLAANQPEAYNRASQLARERKINAWEAEQEVFGATHAELGAWLAAVWGLPLAIVEAQALHHHPAKFLSKAFCPLTAVHAADVIEHEQDPEPRGPASPAFDMYYLAELGLQDRVEAWRQACRGLAQQPVR